MPSRSAGASEICACPSAFAGTTKRVSICQTAERQTFAFPRRGCARAVRYPRSLRKERAQGRPGAGRTHGPRATRKHAAEPQVQPRQPGLPCASGFNGLYALSPVTGLFCHRRLADRSASDARLGSARIMQGLAPASGRQDHTTSPSAPASLVLRLNNRSRETAPPSFTRATPTASIAFRNPAFVTTRTPLKWTGTRQRYG
jgi:hypothetical protein